MLSFQAAFLIVNTIRYFFDAPSLTPPCYNFFQLQVKAFTWLRQTEVSLLMFWSFELKMLQYLLFKIGVHNINFRLQSLNITMWENVVLDPIKPQQ